MEQLRILSDLTMQVAWVLISVIICSAFALLPIQGVARSPWRQSAIAGINQSPGSAKSNVCAAEATCGQSVINKRLGDRVITDQGGCLPLRLISIRKSLLQRSISISLSDVSTPSCRKELLVQEAIENSMVPDTTLRDKGDTSLDLEAGGLLHDWNMGV
jgi:hypothetical protein